MSFVNLARTAVECYPAVRQFIESWLDPAVGAATWLQPEEWFSQGHGITGGQRDLHGIWIPDHTRNGKTYVLTPPPIIADVALEECLKAIHKRTDAYHVFLIPRLYSPLWLHMFYKLSDFIFQLSAGSMHWPSTMHKPLFIGIALPTLSRPPWTLQRTPKVVGLERGMLTVLASGETDGRDLLRELLQIPRRVASLLEDLARKVLCLPRDGEVSSQIDRG